MQKRLALVAALILWALAALGGARAESGSLRRYAIDVQPREGALAGDLSVSGAGVRAELVVLPGNAYAVSGEADGRWPLVLFCRDGEPILADNPEGGGPVREYRVVVPQGANRMIVNASDAQQLAVERLVNALEDTPFDRGSIADPLEGELVADNPWKGKTIVWFGTSIPAGGLNGRDNPDAYPQMVGRLLGANVINEAVGSSCVHCRAPENVSPDNPYGFNPNFEASSRCLTNTEEQMRWICDHYDSPIWTRGTLSAEEWADGWWREQILSCSYERKLDPYLSPDRFPDLFVFDHGHNDTFDYSGSYETYGDESRYTYRGGMNFLIRRILAYNPRARIVIVGEYTDNDYRVPRMQQQVAEEWSLPLLKQWERLGWSNNRTMMMTGSWLCLGERWAWLEDGQPHRMTALRAWIPDGIHPHTDPTRRAQNRMALEIALWLANEVPPGN